MIKLLLFVFVFLAPYTVLSQEDDVEKMYEKCTVSLKWSRRGEDAVVTVTIKNMTKKTLVDPYVYVTFYDDEGNEVAADGKTYFVKVKRGKTKRMEGRIWDYIPEEATEVKGVVEGGEFE